MTSFDEGKNQYLVKSMILLYKTYFKEIGPIKVYMLLL